MPDETKTYLIVGLGLIGGSYARALHQRGVRVTAIDRDADSIAYALGEGFVDAGSVRTDSGLVEEADRIVLGLYPVATAEWIEEHQSRFRPGTLVTDVSGVKRAVIARVQGSLRPDVEFIGTHPMAGREVGGVRNSDSRLFAGANFIVTPTARNTPEGVRFARELGRALGFSRVSLLSPEEHDQKIGYLSQLTHAIAVSLMNADDSPDLAEYTGDSFRELTRIARINGSLWSELFELNRDVLLPEIDRFAAAFGELRQALAEGDRAGLLELFRRSTERRQGFENRE